MNLFIKISLFLLLPYWSPGQKLLEWRFISPQQADSLRHIINTTNNDSVKMSTCRSMGFYYQEIKADSALYYHDIQLQLAKKLHLSIWEAEAYSQRGYALDLLGKYPESFESFSLGKAIAENEKNEPKNWHPYIFSNAENLHSSRLAVLAILYNDFGNLYADVGNNELRKRFDLKAIEIATDINNTRILERSYANLGSIAGLATDSQLLCLNKSINYVFVSGFKKFTGGTYLRLGRLYESAGKLDSAAQYLRSSIHANESANNLRSLADSYIFFSKFFTNRHSIDSALFYAYKAMETAQNTSQANEVLNAYRATEYAYNNTTHVDSAYKYLGVEAQLNDSLKLVRIKNISAYQSVYFGEQLKLRQLEEEQRTYQSRIRIYALAFILFTFFIIAIFLFRNNRQKHKATQKIEQAYNQLKSTQSQLIQAEKMASLGELTAGIAHEIQNPLNFVNNFSEVNKEMIAELKDEIDKGNYNDAKIIADDIGANEEKINHHGKRADSIVKGMLQHSRQTSGTKEPTDINALADEYLRLSFQGMRAKDKNFNATLNIDFDETIGLINIIPQDIGRVLLNLFNNAFYATSGKEKAESLKLYEPLVSVQTKKLNDKIEIKVEDNGNGIPQNIIDKIFQPFFTTKPTGQGTGLGLSLAYDIITKEHNGTIKVESKEGEGTIFIIQLPKV